MARLEFFPTPEIALAFEDAESSALLHGTNLFVAQQVHGEEIICCDDLTPGPLGPADGLWASLAALRDNGGKLTVKSADCAPLIYWDRARNIVAAVHAGWRGMALGIHLKPFRMGFAPRSTSVWVGPCLKGASFEVGADMWTHFGRRADNPLFFHTGSATSRRYFQSEVYLAHTLREAGVADLWMSDCDTFGANEWNSYRRARVAGLARSPASNLSWVGATGALST